MKPGANSCCAAGSASMYFAPFLDADELKFMRDHEQDFLNAFLRSTDVIENVPNDLIEKMVKNISFVRRSGSKIDAGHREHCARLPMPD